MIGNVFSNDPDLAPKAELLCCAAVGGDGGGANCDVRTEHYGSHINKTSSEQTLQLRKYVHN